MTGGKGSGMSIVDESDFLESLEEIDLECTVILPQCPNPARWRVFVFGCEHLEETPPDLICDYHKTEIQTSPSPFHCKYCDAEITKFKFFPV